MINCPKCGAQVEDIAIFCSSCGHQIKTVEIPVCASPVKVPKSPLSNHPVLNAIKKVASSPLFLVAIIAYSVQILASVIGAVAGGTILRNFLYDFGKNISYTLYDMLYSIAEMLGRGSIIAVTIIGFIPAIVTCIGLWITYTSALNRASDTMKTSGLTTIKVITIIQLVCTCIGLVITEAIIGICMLLVATKGFDAETAAFFIFFVILFATIYVLNIIYLAKIIKSINTARNSIVTGTPSDKISSFVAIWTFISVTGFVFRLFTNFISSAAAITSLVCFGILIFKYKSEMKALAYSQKNTVDPTI